MADTRKARQQGRKDKEDKRRATIAERRSKMEQARKGKNQNSTEPNKMANSTHERPATAETQGRTAYHDKSDRTGTIRNDIRASTNDRKSTNRPNERIVREPIEQPKSGNVDGSPSKKERKIVKPDKAPIKAERKFISDSQNKRALNVDKQPQKAIYPASREKEPQKQFIKERRITIKRGIGSQKKVKITNAATAIKKRGQKK